MNQEIPNVSRWVRQSESLCKTGEPKYLQEIRFRTGQMSQRYNLHYYAADLTGRDPRSDWFQTIAQAKKYLGDGWGWLRWQHQYVCPDCDAEIKFFQTDYADFHCENCQKSFTRFGEQASKH